MTFVNRRGIVILWVAIGVTLVTLLAVATLPLVLHGHRQLAVLRTAEILRGVELAITDTSTVDPPQKSFTRRIFRNPKFLTQLVYPITDTQRAQCNDTFLKVHVNNWESWGPFSNVHVDSALGLATPIGQALDSIGRDPPWPGTKAVPAGPLLIRFPIVDSVDAVMLDQFIDGGTGSADGIVQWTLLGNGSVQMDYRITAANAC